MTVDRVRQSPDKLNLKRCVLGAILCVLLLGSFLMGTYIPWQSWHFILMVTLNAILLELLKERGNGYRNLGLVVAFLCLALILEFPEVLL